MKTTTRHGAGPRGSMTNLNLRLFQAGLTLLLVITALLAMFIGPVGVEGQNARDGQRIELATESELQELVLLGGSKLYGRVVGGGDPVRFELGLGNVIDVPRSTIESLTLIQGHMVNGRFWRKDPNATRLFFAPTARTIRQGGGYFALYEFGILPFLTVAPHDRVLLSGGTPLFFGGGEDRLFYFAGKAKLVDKKGVQVAAGALAFDGLDDESSAGVAFVVGTFGNEDRALTAGLAYGWEDGDLSSSPTPMIGGEVRVSAGVKIVSENYVLDGENLLISVGPRFIRERMSVDLAMVGFLGSDGDGAFAFPFVNFVWNW